jgi:pimeloyl-ACP methyl ester carboxylesterase
MGASEGTLLSAEAASRAPEDVYGVILYAVLSTPLKDALRFMAGEGTFMQIGRRFDTNKDGRISPAEYENEPARRVTGLTGTTFAQLDADGDGAFDSEDLVTVRKGLIDAINAGTFKPIHDWLSRASAVSLPTGWLEDHYAHPGNWTFLSKLTGPVGIFHGEADANTPVAATRSLETQARAAGKNNFEFHYFVGLDHSLGIGAYFAGRPLPAGHVSIFEFIRKHTRVAQ